jgi:hypothetical protein
VIVDQKAGPACPGQQVIKGHLEKAGPKAFPGIRAHPEIKELEAMLEPLDPKEIRVMEDRLAAQARQVVMV